MTTYFVTAQTWGRRRLLHSQRMGELFVRTIQEYRRQRKYLLHDYVVMPDHVHLVITPEVTIEKAMQFIKGGFSFRAGKESGLTGRIWNHRFDGKAIKNGAAFEAVRSYIRRNPVKAGLVSDETEYLFSSANPTAELDEVPEGLKPQTLCGAVYHG
jgi:putative transposase